MILYRLINQSINLNKFDNSHLCIISLSGHSPQDTSVSSLSLSITLRSSLKKWVDQILIIHPSKCLTPSVQIASLSKLNHVINVLAYSLCAYEGGLDTSVADDLGCECAEECLTLISGFTELGEFFSVAHHWKAGSIDCSGDGASSECTGSCEIWRLDEWGDGMGIEKFKKAGLVQGSLKRIGWCGLAWNLWMLHSLLTENGPSFQLIDGVPAVDG